MLHLTNESEEIYVMLHTNRIYKNFIIISGINVSLPPKIDTLFFDISPEHQLKLKHEYGEIELTWLNDNTFKIDSLNIDNWETQTLAEFNDRAERANCLDQRTEEEKNRVIEMGVLDDDFDDLVDIPYNSELDSILEK
ncbi:MAG: hypothetical protein OCD76_09620 [Reichenbachiella sp.]